MSNRPFILFTGIDLLADAKFKEGSLFCYLCKRKEDAESICMSDTGLSTRHLDLKEVAFADDKATLRFLLCDECRILLDSIAAPGKSGLRRVE